MAFKYITEKGPARAYMMANEAVVRAALESDVKVYSTYPGSPTVEILSTFEGALKHYDLRMELSVNEKVALETAAGASFVGMRSFVSMKSVGVNVASDALYVLAYTGVKGGCVLLLADDPHAHSSQSEQDGRWFGYTSYLPMFDPSSPQEAYDMVKEAYDLSERYSTLVLLRTTTRVNHQSGIVDIQMMNRTPIKKSDWGNDHNYTAVGVTARAGKLDMLRKMEEMKGFSEGTPFNRLQYFDGEDLHEGAPPRDEGYELGIVTSGVPYNYTVEALGKLGIRARILKIGLINPVPSRKISEFLAPLKKVMVVEELSPYLEGFIRGICKDANPSVELMGKGFGPFTEYSEYNIPMLVEALSLASGRPMPFDYRSHVKKMETLADILPIRPPGFCAGCPHRGTFTSLKRAIGSTPIFFSNDIGCYTMLVLPPIEWSDSQLCMGASLGIAAGVNYGANNKVVCAIGDSTLFHAGIPGIANAVHNKHDLTLVVLHNSVTAMTGQQTHPAHELTVAGKEGISIDIERMLRGLGIEKIVNLNAFEIRKNLKLMKEALDFKGVSAIISHGECALYHFRNLRREGAQPVPFYVDREICKRPYNCIKDFLCPAISIDERDGTSRIAPEICVGCGECAQMCGFGAIKSTATLHGGENKVYYTKADHDEFLRSKEVGK
ncbi:MAG: indolepyruvate ferredoxin oxidoreductase subunit alpha [Candidatus Thermoplasmatota archaeon]|nr:indolepyruvate ferredoxin oxidoreductase subunit alpha [Candidatus Thermoplasmatota archaeon]